MKTIKSNRLRADLKEVLDSVRDGGHIGVERYQDADAVLVPRTWYDTATAALVAAQAAPVPHSPYGWWASYSDDTEGTPQILPIVAFDPVTGPLVAVADQPGGEPRLTPARTAGDHQGLVCTFTATP